MELSYLFDFWSVIIAMTAVIVAAVLLCVNFFNRPTKEQTAKVKQWLLLAVTEAEADLGGGTGKLKLRYVYDMFLQRFPWLVKVVSFDTFSLWVDEALVEMRNLLNKNEAVANLVKGE